MEVRDYWNKLQELWIRIKEAQDLLVLGHKIVTKAHELETRLQCEKMALKTMFFRKAFSEGVEAFKRGNSEDSCPYPSVSAGNNERTD